MISQICIEKITTTEEAKRVVDFLLSDQSFDDTRYTPGELIHFRELPYRALTEEILIWYAADEEGRIVGMNCVMENEQKTGGYSWDYLVVHHSCRKSGVAASLISSMFQHLEAIKARYLVTYTCDLPEYVRIRQLFDRNGFTLVGRCPDYYYEGEDRLIYYRKLV